MQLQPGLSNSLPPVGCKKVEVREHTAVCVYVGRGAVPMEAAGVRHCEPPLLALAGVVLPGRVGGSGLNGEHRAVHAQLRQEDLGPDADDLVGRHGEEHEVVVPLPAPEYRRLGRVLQQRYRSPAVRGRNPDLSFGNKLLVINLMKHTHSYMHINIHACIQTCTLRHLVLLYNTYHFDDR